LPARLPYAAFLELLTAAAQTAIVSAPPDLIELNESAE
jgi:hypothetical protein